MMKSIFIILCAVMLWGCGAQKDEVVVIPKTSSYHREKCAKVMMAKTEWLSRADAVKRNFKPCPYCKPDAQYE